MKLEELKYVLNEMYDFDISKRTRVRKVVYAKKVFIQLAREFGYGWTEMSSFINLNHDNCIFHYKSFGDIKPMDLMIYNSCIDYFNIPMQKIPTVQSINGSPLLNDVIYSIKSLSHKDLKYFNSNVLNVFLLKLKQEKYLKELVNESKIQRDKE